MFSAFYDKWIGKRVDFDGWFGFQCVDLIRQFWLEATGRTNTNGVDYAKQYWSDTPGGVLAICDKISSTDVRAGDVVPLAPVSGVAGHIAIATGKQDANGFEAFEQNGQTGGGSGLGGDAIRTRWIAKNRILGLLRLKGGNSQPTEQAPSLHRITFYGSYRTRWGVNSDGSVGPAIDRMYLPAEGYTYDILGQNGTYFKVNSPSLGRHVYVNTDPAFVDPSLTKFS